MALLFIIFIFHSLISQLIEVLKLKAVALVAAVVLLITIWYFTFGLEYTADYRMYAFLFKNDLQTDFMFRQFSTLFSSYGYTFHDLYVFHIAVTVLLYLSLISKFSHNIWFIFLAYIVLDYVHFANQIRYFMGFPMMLWAFYCLHRSKYFLFALFAVLACLSHSALIVLLTFVPAYLWIKPQKYLKHTLLLSIFCFLIVYIAFTQGMGREIEHFGEYFSKKGVSSFFGGFYNAVPYLIFTLFLYLETRRYRMKHPEWQTDRQFVFLYKLTFYTVIFIPASFFLQIAGHRYVMPFVVIYGIYYLYLIRDEVRRVKVQKIFAYSAVCAVISVIIYVLPSYIMSENHFMNEVERMLKSVEYLNYSEW